MKIGTAGNTTIPLQKKGENKPQKLAAKLEKSEIEIIFSSPKRRAKETAQILGKSLGCRLKIINDVRERGYGVVSGMEKSEAKKKYPDQVELMKDYRNTLLRGESYADFKKRITDALGGIAKTDFTAIAIVTHGGPIKCISREILKLGEIKDLPDCAVFELDKEKSKIALTKKWHA